MSHAPLATPESPPLNHGQGVGGAEDEEFRWELLVPHALHPIQVGIVEAYLYLDRPLSPSELVYVFAKRYTSSHLSYHVGVLKAYGALELVGTEEVRGATKNLYVLVREPGLS